MSQSEIWMETESNEIAAESHLRKNNYVGEKTLRFHRRTVDRAEEATLANQSEMVH